MSKVVQSGLVSKPWKELLELIAGLPERTQQEVIGGKMALLRHKLEEEHGESWKKMLNWDKFNVEIDGFNGNADASALFRLQEFTELNNRLQNGLRAWIITTLNAAAIAEGSTVRVKAVVGPANSVEFMDDASAFPSEELMTKLLMIAPEKKQK